DDQMIVTMSYWDKFGFPQAMLMAFNRELAEWAWEVEFPNCADDLQLQPEGDLAILAPQSCSLHDIIVAQPEVTEDWEDFPTPEPGEGDPISIIDLATGEHRANVPGFGPVQWSPDGQSAVGFTRRESLMVEWNYFQSDAFGLVVVSVEDFKWRVTDVGDERPRYLYQPDGAAILVSGAADGTNFTAALSVADGGLTDLAGAQARLDTRIVSPLGDAVFVSDGGALYRIDLASSAVAPIELDLDSVPVTGDLLNMRPQGDLLVWTDRQAGAHHFVSAESLMLHTTISLTGPIAGQ
ncbi:MAG: hypothetical protein ACI9OJ_003710, partial [Myxococcota bacterium]